MGFSEDMIAGLRGDSLPEISTLIAATLPGGLSGQGLDRALDPDRLFDLARLNKMLGWLPVKPADLPQGCAGLAPRLLQVRLRTMAMNRQAMAVTAEATLALSRANLRHVVMKGPFQQMAVHGDPFRRPSGDIDLYVAPRDRKRAARVLQDLGFAALEQDQALWWIPFLGEQHFQRPSDGAVIDLHHRLQQAGLPDWRGAPSVLDRAVMVPHGDAVIPVLSPADGCLLMAGTLAKALLAHEPCGWAAADLPLWLARLEPGQRKMLDRVAQDSGQDLTLALGLLLAQACGDYPALDAESPARLPRLPDDPAILRDLVFQPWQREVEAPRRRQMLQMLTRGRPHILALEAARTALAQQVMLMLARRENLTRYTTARASQTAHAGALGGKASDLAVMAAIRAAKGAGGRDQS